MALIANETMPSPPGERPVRIVTVPDRFWSRFWAVLALGTAAPFLRPRSSASPDPTPRPAEPGPERSRHGTDAGAEG